MEKIKLTDTGEMLIVPGRPGLTDESNLPVDGVLGQHECFRGSPKGMVKFHESSRGWVIYCNGCGLSVDVPEHVTTYGALREYSEKEFGK